jgi:hypothetical protein
LQEVRVMEDRPHRDPPGLRVERVFETSRLENELLAVAYERVTAQGLRSARLQNRVDPGTAVPAHAGLLLPLVAKGA